MILNVTKQKLKLDTDTVAEGALNYATLELRCDDSWREFSKTVRFAVGDDVFDVPDVEEGRSYYIPREVLREGRVWVGVVGVADGNRVATTERASFYVKGAVASGNTPTVTEDAYAVYVRDALRHRRAAEESEKVAAQCLEKCRELAEEIKSLSQIAIGSAKMCDSVREEVHGMMSAVGMAYRDIREAEKSIASANSRYSASEKSRDKGERARAFNESKRAFSEDERRQKETEREAAEVRRNTAEQLRSLNEVRRDDRLREMELRLAEAEGVSRTPLTHINITLRGENELESDDCTEVESITLFGNTVANGNALHGVGEDGFVRLTCDGGEMEIPVSQPLYSVGDICDSVTLTSYGEVTVCRCTRKISINGTESFICDKGEDGSIMYVTPIGETPLYECRDIISSPLEGCSSIFADGDYLFFCVDGNIYPDAPTLAEALKSSPVDVVYPILTPHHESEGSVELNTLPRRICYSGKISAECRKDLFKSLALLNEKINMLEKEKENENT